MLVDNRVGGLIRELTMTLEETVARLRTRQSVPLFVGMVWDPAVRAALQESDPQTFFASAEIRDAGMTACAVAGLHLWNDDFSASHNLCQGIRTATGSYLHALCHRREGHQGEGLAANLGNARYWIRRTGAHPAYPAVYRAALELLDSAGTGWAAEAASRLRAHGSWDAGLVIDWFAEAEAGRLSGPALEALQELQVVEISTLMDWCLAHATG